MGIKSKVEPGIQFNKLLVLECVGSRKRGDSSRLYWKCQCDCGNIVEIASIALSTGNTKSCGCLNNKPSFRYKGFKELSGVFWRTMHKRANERKIVFDPSITIEEVYHILEIQDFKCKLSGVPILLHRNYKQNKIKQTASLDRVDSSKGYERGNIQWVHKKVNYMKNILDELEFIAWCKLIANKNQDPSLFT